MLQLEVHACLCPRSLAVPAAAAAAFVREGIVLHDVQWQEDDKLRPVLHRLSLVEMAVPYADPR